MLVTKLENKEEDIDTVGAELISNIITNSIKLVTKEGNVANVPITNITVDAGLKNGGLVAVDVKVGYRTEGD